MKIMLLNTTINGKRSVRSFAFAAFLLFMFRTADACSSDERMSANVATPGNAHGHLQDTPQKTGSSLMISEGSAHGVASKLLILVGILICIGIVVFYSNEKLSSSENGTFSLCSCSTATNSEELRKWDKWDPESDKWDFTNQDVKDGEETWKTFEEAKTITWEQDGEVWLKTWTASGQAHTPQKAREEAVKAAVVMYKETYAYRLNLPSPPVADEDQKYNFTVGGKEVYLNFTEAENYKPECPDCSTDYSTAATRAWHKQSFLHHKHFNQFDDRLEARLDGTMPDIDNKIWTEKSGA